MAQDGSNGSQEATDKASEATAEWAASVKRKALIDTTAKMSTPVRKMGRPSEYTEERARQLCAYIANGMSLRKACEQEGMPATGTVYRWLDEHDEFQRHFARAERHRADFLAEEALENVADEQIDVQRAKLISETKRWFASRLHASKYGDRQILSGDKDNPLFDPLGQVLGAVTGKTRGIPSDKG